ncbi:MAG TPA: hypothetical protein VNJ07_05675 [Chitinophagales bacterium]|nr:hypothetical protein [Chitinophagales bacterium]
MNFNTIKTLFLNGRKNGEADNNNERPHDSLGDLTPTEYLLKYGKHSAFPTFQQDDGDGNDRKFLISTVSKAYGFGGWVFWA